MQDEAATLQYTSPPSHDGAPQTAFMPGSWLTSATIGVAALFVVTVARYLHKRFQRPAAPTRKSHPPPAPRPTHRRRHPTGERKLKLVSRR